MSKADSSTSTAATTSHIISTPNMLVFFFIAVTMILLFSTLQLDRQEEPLLVPEGDQVTDGTSTAPAATTSTSVDSGPCRLDFRRVCGRPCLFYTDTQTFHQSSGFLCASFVIISFLTFFDLIGISEIRTVANTKDANAGRKLDRCRVFKGISPDFLNFQTKNSSVSPEILVQYEWFDHENNDEYLHHVHDDTFRKSSWEAEEDYISKEEDYVSYDIVSIDSNCDFFGEREHLKRDINDVLSNRDTYNDSNANLFEERVLQNGNIYVGSLCSGIPEGYGKYLWADGCMYEGQWEGGKVTGKGRISWPSGATYEGYLQASFANGIGTFTGVNSSIYKGSWYRNAKNGYGIKSYDNGDVYEGSWSEGMPHGEGRYIWKNGNEYFGDWVLGAMCGKGWLKWGCGDKYDGEWLDGFQHGHGIYTWADGSTFVGTWRRGVKDGKGIFFPPRIYVLEGLNNIERSRTVACNDRSLLTSSRSSPHFVVSEQLAGRISRASSSESSIDKFTYSSETSTGCEGGLEDFRSHDNRWSVDDLSVVSLRQENASRSFSVEEDLSTGYHLADQDVTMTPIVERVYAEGVLIDEILLGNPAKPLRKWLSQHTEVPTKPGATIFEGHQSYDLMLSLQLGMRYTVEQLASEPEHEVVSSDFGHRARIWKCLPREGSQLTPEQRVDFKWKDYCPIVFRHLRELFRIDAKAYIQSICGNRLREFSSPGKSGSVFYLSQDDRYMIKTIRKSEINALLGMLPNYYKHIQTFGNTLLTKFFGLHQIESGGGHKVRFVVMGNMFCTELPIHRRFDLKGSSHGRYANKVNLNENTTLKDLDLDYVFLLEPSWHQTLIRQIECDCKFLENERIMDYSLLLGIHFRAPQFSAIFTRGDSQPVKLPSVDASKNYGLVANEAETRLISSVLKMRGGPSNDETSMIFPGATRLEMQLGINMPARAVRRPHLCQENCDAMRGDHLTESHDVVLYFGIIDVLQVYDMGKRLENAYKSLQFDPLSISAIDPRAYSRRFQDFMSQIFLDAQERENL